MASSSENDLAELIAVTVAAALEQHFHRESIAPSPSSLDSTRSPSVVLAPPPSSGVSPLSPSLVQCDDDVDPGPSVSRIFYMKTPREGVESSKFSNLCGSAYLKHFHKEIWTQFRRRKETIRGWFLISKDDRVESILFANYKNNPKAKKDCLQFIKDNLRTLGDLGPFHTNGQRTYIPFSENIVFDYFITHKTYWRHVYQDKQSQHQDLEEDGVEARENEEHLLLEQNSQEQSPCIEAHRADEDHEGISQPRPVDKIKRHSKVISSGKKKRRSLEKQTDSLDVDVKNLSDFDKLTIVQCAMGLTNRAQVLRSVKTWLSERKKVRKFVPKLKDIQKMTNEEVVHSVAKWAIRKNLVQYVPGASEGFELETWKCVE